MCNLILIKVQKHFNGVRTVFLTNGAAAIEHPQEKKNEAWFTPYTWYKN